ncbi:MAG TPA: hypothetical protein VIM41_06065 [Gammaproteobacteria bacterium]
MSGLHVTRVELSVKVVVPISLLQKHLPAPIDKLGEQLSNEIQKRVGQAGLGYYPALDFFRDQETFPDYLLDAVDEVANLAAEIAAHKINDVLVPIFSNVKINNIQCLAYALPGVRPNLPAVSAALSKHYTPNILKLEMVVSVLQKQPPQEGFEKYAANTVYRWLSEIFESVDIASARLL